MKREQKYQSGNVGYSGGANGVVAESAAGFSGGGKPEYPLPLNNTTKAKTWDEEQQRRDASGEDELLAVLGYNVRSSDMADVAQKLEQLEMVMGSSEEDGISHLSSNTVHYNPSDLSAWVQSMLAELNGPLQSQRIDDPVVAIAESSALTKFESQSMVYSDDSEYDLRAIPGFAAYPPDDSFLDNENPRKRLKKSNGSDSESVLVASASSSSSSEPSRPVVLVDSQETGVRLVHTLLACAEAVQQDNLKLADALLKHIGLLAASQAGAMRKVATYFAEALARRIYGIHPQNCLDSSYTDLLQMHFYESCPNIKFAHFTANQAILEAFATASKVHVIDFGLQQGLQWPPLMQALAIRPGGPPTFRLTGIGPPQLDDTDALQQVGWKLAQFANEIGVEFEFRGFFCNSLADLEPSVLDLRPPEFETVAVNSVFEMHRLLSRPGAVEKVLSCIKSLKPKIVTMVEQVADHNGPLFLDRFTEALHYYSSLFDSLESSSAGLATPSQDLVMSEDYLGRQICNVVACEGPDRVERHETLTQWRTRMESSGFGLVHLGSNAFKQASTLLALFAGGDGYRVDESNGCLMLGWHTRPLIATSAWAVVANES